MEEKEDFKSLMAKFHAKSQEMNGIKAQKPVPIGNKPAPLTQKPKPAFVPKKPEPESEYSPMHPVAAWRALTKELSSPNLKELGGGQIGANGTAIKVFERGGATSAEPAPRSPLAQFGQRKTLKEKHETSDSSEVRVPQTRKPMDFHHHLMKKLSQSPPVNHVAKMPPSKDRLPPKPLKCLPVNKPYVPRRMVLPTEQQLGPKPVKPKRPPYVDLKRFMDSRGMRTQTPLANGKIPDCLKQRFETKDLFSPLQPHPRNSSTGSFPQSLSSSCSEEQEEYDDVETVRPIARRAVVSPPTPSKPKPCPRPREGYFYDDVGSIQNIFPPHQQCKSQELRSNYRNLILKQREMEEKEFRKKFKFEGEIKILTRMMVDPNAIIKKCGPYDLPHKRGDFLDVIQMCQDKLLCRNIRGKFGYVPKISLLSIEIYDDVEVFEELYDDIELVNTAMVPQVPQKPRPPSESELNTMRKANEKIAKKIKKEEKEEKDIRKKFKLEGEIKVLTQMMVDPNARIKKGGGKYLSHKRGEILDVIQRTSLEKLLCRNSKGKYGYVPRLYMLQVEREVYDYVDMSGIKSK